MAVLVSLVTIAFSPDIHAFTISMVMHIAPSVMLESLLERLSFDHLLYFYPTFFIIGVAYYVFGQVKFNRYVAAVAVIIWLLSLKTSLLYATSLICLPYVILFVAQARAPYLNNAGMKGDFSYGLYIYAFLVQQILLNYVPEMPVILLFILSMVMTFPLAYLSWTLIESKALRLENVDPRKKIGQYMNTLASMR